MTTCTTSIDEVDNFNEIDECDDLDKLEFAGATKLIKMSSKVDAREQRGPFTWSMRPIDDIDRDTDIDVVDGVGMLD